MSAGGMPELGSKINLISKADIRYEGRLFTVDPQECTIALANVRSFGTEDRETQYPIAPQSQIYDYILFRGSDIKDIRVVNNGMPHPNDPAIMQMQLPNGQHLMPQFPMPSPMSATPMGNYGNPFGAMGTIGGLGGAGLAPGSFAGLNQQKPKPTNELHAQNDGIPDHLNHHQQPQQHQHQHQQHQMLNQQQQQQLQHHQQSAGGGGIAAAVAAGGSAAANSGSDQHKEQGASRSTTPVSLHSRKSPTVDMAVQVNQGPHIQQQQHGNRRYQQPRSGGGVTGNQGYNNQRARRDSGRMGEPHPHQHPQQDNRNMQHHQHQHRGGQMQQHQHQQMQARGPGASGWINRNPNQPNHLRNNSRGRVGPMQQRPNQGGYRQPGGGVNLNKGRPKNTIKFEQDYDFEQANNKFEELRSQLSKLKVGDEVTKAEQQVNGETDKKDDSGNETGAGEHEQEEEEITVCYDKTKSFFDNISCEAATDRTKGKNRTDWRQERKLNTETFGVSSTRRGNFRGRVGGGYYQRNMNMRSGGYRNNYRSNMGSNQGYRRNNNNRNAQSTGLPNINKNQQNQPHEQHQQNNEQSASSSQSQQQRPPPPPPLPQQKKKDEQLQAQSIASAAGK